MKINDFLLCTFDGDTQTPPIQYALEITEINTNGSVVCYLAQSGQFFTFKISGDIADLGNPWTGTDETGQTYIVNTHDVFTPGAANPAAGDLAVITFDDAKRYLCYVNSTTGVIDVTLYYDGYPNVSIDGLTVSASNWDLYPVDSIINGLEQCIAGDFMPTASAGTIEYNFIPPEWLDYDIDSETRAIWVQNNLSSKTFFPDEPANNIDGLPVPYWIDPDLFQSTLNNYLGQIAVTIIGDWSKPVNASYFVIHDTAGNKEPNINNLEQDAVGISLFLGTEKTVFVPSRNGVRNDWHRVGWGARVSNKRPEEFVHIELSPYNNYSNLDKAVYKEYLQFGIDGLINMGTNFTIRQYELLALCYIICSLRRGTFLTVTTHREVDYSFSKDAHGDPKDFDYNYFYNLICYYTGLENVTFGIQQDRADYHNQVNMGGFINEFWPFVKKQAGVLRANQYGKRKAYPGDQSHHYIDD